MTESRRHTRMRARWCAIGAAVAVTIGAGGLGVAQAAISTGERPVTVTVAAERILDTRVDLGLAGKFAEYVPRDLQVTGSVAVASGGTETVVPVDAVGVIVNVTVIRPNRPGFLSLRPSGAVGPPTTSTVNFTEGSIEANSATVDLNDGKIQIWLSAIADAGRADVAIDVVGYTIDHDHDDRYYTEAEVDDLTKPTFANINSDGVAHRGNSGLVSSERTATGKYRLTFDRDVTQCAAATSDLSFDTTHDISADTLFGSTTSAAPNDLHVQVTDSADGFANTSFAVVLMCP